MNAIARAATAVVRPKVLASLATILAGLAVLPAGCASYKPDAPAGVDLSGYWVLDPQASDDAARVIAKILDEEGGPPRNRSGGTGEAPPPPATAAERKAIERRIEAARARRARDEQELREELLASDHLEIEQHSSDLVVTTEFTTRSIRAGSKVQISMPGGGLADANAGWDGKAFAITRSVPGGPRVVEHYRLISDDRQLEATLAISGHGPLAGTHLRRVYDRTSAPPARRPTAEVPQR
jgi:hypothetical protein